MRRSTFAAAVFGAASLCIGGPPIYAQSHTISIHMHTDFDDECDVSWGDGRVNLRPGGNRTIDQTYGSNNPGTITTVIKNLNGRFPGEDFGSGKLSINLTCAVSVDGRQLLNNTWSGWDPKGNRSYSATFVAPPPPPPFNNGGGVKPPPPPPKPTARSYKVTVNGQPTDKVEQCFGAVGAGCSGVGNVAEKRQNPDGSVTLWVSVGSIEHDNCCLHTPQGSWCRPEQQDALANVGHIASSYLQDLAAQKGYCAAEWRKAFWNAMDKRQWQVQYPVASLSQGWTRYPSSQWSDDLTPANARPTMLPDPLFGHTMPGGTNGETVMSAALLAPGGTTLDIEDARFCQSGAFSQSWSGGLQWVDRPVYGFRWIAARGVCSAPGMRSVQSVTAALPPVDPIPVGVSKVVTLPIFGGFQVVSATAGVRAQIAGQTLTITGVARGNGSVTVRNGSGQTAILPVTVN